MPTSALHDKATKAAAEARKTGKREKISKELVKADGRVVRRVSRRDQAILNPNQARFVEYYLIDGNAKQAYIKAYGPTKSAGSASISLLRMPKVQAAVERKQKTLADRLGITQEGVLREMKAIAFCNLEDYIKIDSDGQAIIDLREMSRDQAGALASVTSKRYFDKESGSTVTETTLKPYDKKAALEILGRYVGIKGFGTTKMEVTGAEGGPIKIENIHELTEEQLLRIIAGGPVLEGN